MYRQFGAYYLIPAIWNDGMDEPRFLTNLPVLKRALNVYKRRNSPNNTSS